MKKEITRTIRISEEKWLHREGGAVSYFIRSKDQKQCCLGFYLKACGVKPQMLTDVKYPGILRYRDIPQEARWLRNGKGDSNAALDLMEYNDFSCMTREEQKEKIAKEFLKHGVKVIFTK